MTLTQTSLLAILGIPLALLAGGAAHGQQASFAVAITLHAASKPMTVAQLCPEGKPTDVLGATVRVSCPAVAAGRAGITEQVGPAFDKVQRQPEVVVTF